MATSATLVQYLAAGIVDASGNALASGLVRFYQPGTTTPITAYSDSSASSTITQPLTLGADGRGKAYTLVPCRIIVKNAADTTTIFDSDYAANIRAEQVLITNANVNGGSETTLNAWLTAGADTYQEGSSATSRTGESWRQETHILATDYGASGNDSDDDLAELQALIDRALDADRTNATAAKTRRIKIPAGTWKINGTLSIAVASGTKAIQIVGDGPRATIIKQYGTADDGLDINYTSSTDTKTTIEGIGWTCSTTSSGSAIQITNCEKVVIRNCESAGYRIGFDVNSCTETRVIDCEVVSSDGDTNAIGIDLGARGRARDCIVTGTSSLGIGIRAAATDAVIDGCEVYSTATGISCVSSGALVRDCIVTPIAAGTGISATGTRARVQGCTVTVGASGTGITLTGANGRAVDNVVVGSSSTTGINLGADHCQARGNEVTGFTTGINVGAHDGCVVLENDASVSNTTGVSVNTSATNVYDDRNQDGTGLFPLDGVSIVTASTAVAGSVTPSGFDRARHVAFYATASSGSGALTIGATATTYLRAGCTLYLYIVENTGTITGITWNAQYKRFDGANTMSDPGAVSTSTFYSFVWTGSVWRQFSAYNVT